MNLNFALLRIGLLAIVVGMWCLFYWMVSLVAGTPLWLAGSLLAVISMCALFILFGFITIILLMIIAI